MKCNKNPFDLHVIPLLSDPTQAYELKLLTSVTDKQWKQLNLYRANFALQITFKNFQ